MFKNAYTGLWLLLALALAAVLTVAFSDDISIGGKTLRKTPLIADLWKDHKAEADSVAKADSIAEVKSKPLEIKTDSLPQSILIFGDSMTFNLALRLAQYAKQNGHTIHSVNWDSSNTKIWAEHDTLAHYIREFRPTQIFISLGSNELYIQKPETRLPYIEKILAVIDTIPYVWIGPPNWKEDAGINDLLERTCSRGSFFRSAGMEFKRKADHIHPTRQSSADWVDSIMRWIPKSAHPFLAAPPDSTITKSNPNIIFLKALNK
ncbi:MAG: SGNH/GDSL hydrolase family protein [Muribaculaceae bacterium]|nr:SGNH/GDSL hydrolase family protein [Muribaculaceae bacterium]